MGDVERCPPGLNELGALLELAPDAIFVADLGGRYTLVNEAGICRSIVEARGGSI